MFRIAIAFVIALAGLFSINANAGEPRTLKVGIYIPDQKVTDLFNGLAPYEDLPAELKVKSDYYKGLFIKNDLNNGVGFTILQVGMSAGSTPLAFKQYIHFNNRYGQCGVALQDVKRGGNYNYYIGVC